MSFHHPNKRCGNPELSQMIYPMIQGRRWATVFLTLFATLWFSYARAEEAEFRAFWADAWHEGFQTPAQVTKLISDVRAANCNAVFVQVRKRGDAYYRGSTLDATAGVVRTNFDPLADVIQKAHDTTLGPRIEVHAWFVTYPATTIMKLANKSPIIVARQDTKHPFNRHADWLDESESGQTADGTQYSFDPGHPEVQRHLFNVAMDIISRYDIDGFHFDHARYPGNGWGYNKASVARFNAQQNRSGKPLRDDPEWLQFRRDQITALIRKIYLSAYEVKPELKISASTITWAPGVVSDEQWRNSAAYKNALQDWRGWMEEGILDMNVPMVFFKQGKLMDARADSDWCGYIKDHQYNRCAVIGQAGYLNSLSESKAQVKTALQPSATGHKAAGIVFYSYASPSKAALVKRDGPLSDSPTNGPAAFFQSSVPTPEMAWKSHPVKGHILGYALGGNGSNVLDGAVVTLNGPTNRTLTSDATGCFGAVDLTPGNYNVRVSFSGYRDQTNTFSVIAGKVTKQSILLSKTTP